MDWRDIFAHLGGDIRRGVRVPMEDMAIAKLVVMPFTLTLAVVVGWMTWAPSLALIVFWAVVQGIAALWNAGWRARTGTPGEAAALDGI